MIDLLKFDTELKRLASENKFSGCIKFSNRGKNIFHGAYGYASRSYLAENKIDTKFNIASVGKIFTSVAILQLVEKGMLCLNTPITEYCRRIVSKEISDKITIRQLLTHTSGLGDYIGDTISSTYQTTYEEFDDFKDIVKNAILLFEPGSKWSYSNLGFLLLGFIIKHIAGDYYDYVKENIFNKAGMNNSGFWFFDEVLENAATSYFFDDKYKKWRCWVNKPVTRGTSGGGAYSTVDDLTKFINSLFDFTLINPLLVDEATTAKPELNSPHFGYGFFVNGNEISHGGDGTGVNSKFTRNKNGVTMVILSNVSSGAGEAEKMYNDLNK
jgi:CubicO group peptidase (beta-lactamase class C family)